MLKILYQLNSGVQPQDTIETTIQQVEPGFSQKTDCYMGRYYSGATDTIYGEIDTDSAYQGDLEAALVGWSPSFQTDQQALDWLDALIPEGTEDVGGKTAGAAYIDGNGQLQKDFT